MEEEGRAAVHDDIFGCLSVSPARDPRHHVSPFQAPSF